MVVIIAMETAIVLAGLGLLLRSPLGWVCVAASWACVALFLFGLQANPAKTALAISGDETASGPGTRRSHIIGRP